MSQIATRARLSVGQIYRHFRHKEALIEGIVQEDVDRQLNFFEHSPAFTGLELREMQIQLLATLPAVADRRHAALIVEIAAESTRNRAVREIVLANQHRAHLLLRERLEAASPGLWPEGQADLRLRMVHALVQGLVMQVAVDRQGPSRKLLAQMQAMTVQLLTPPISRTRL